MSVRPSLSHCFHWNERDHRLLQRFPIKRESKSIFNALKYTQELEKAGFSRDQAEASVKLLIDVMNDNFSTKSDLNAAVVILKSDLREAVATSKSDLKEAVVTLRSEIKECETRLGSEIIGVKSDLKEISHQLDSSIREVEYRMTIKLGAMMTLAIGVTATLVKIIPSMH